MAHTRSQDFEAHFNTLQSSLIKTQQEVKQFSANVATINATMQSSMEEIKQDLTTQLQSVFSSLCTKITLPLTHPHIIKVNIPLIPITFSTITFNATYAFHGQM
jgi:hypothetical protein